MVKVDFLNHERKRSFNSRENRKKIYLIRKQKVMLDRDLAKLYGVPTKRLNEQVKRNRKRFPVDFMFRLTKDEMKNIRSHSATLKWGKHSKYLPYAFTEQGISMLSSVLHSERAIQVNIVIMRTFVKLRRILATHTELAKKLSELEDRIAKHDEKIQIIFEAIRQLMVPPVKSKRRIGFHKE